MAYSIDDMKDAEWDYEWSDEYDYERGYEDDDDQDLRYDELRYYGPDMDDYLL